MLYEVITDPATHSLRVRAELPNGDDRLRPDTSSEGYIQSIEYQDVVLKVIEGLV